MKIKFNVTGLDCPVCASKLATMIAEKEGIDHVKINFLTEKLTIDSNLAENEVYEKATQAAKAFSSSVKITK